MLATATFTNALLRLAVVVLLLWNTCNTPVVEAAFTTISVGGGYTSSSNAWACGLLPVQDSASGSIECFEPEEPLNDDKEYVVKGRLDGAYTGISVGGSSTPSQLYACAVESITGRIQCWEPYTLDEALPYQAKGDLTPPVNEQPYTHVEVGGSSSGSYFAACAIRDGGIDCFNPYSPTETGVTYEIMGSLPGDYSSVSVGGQAEDEPFTHEFACTTLNNPAQIDCFDPKAPGIDGTVPLSRLGHLPGSYQEVSVDASSSPSYIYGCAARADRTAVDCFEPYTFEDTVKSYTIAGSAPGSFEQVSVGGGSSPSYLYACGLRESGIDCFSPYFVPPVPVTTTNTTYEVTGSVAGNYHQVALGGAAATDAFYACAIRTSGEAIDCFNPYTFTEIGSTYEIGATYFLPATAAPTVSPPPMSSPTTETPTVATATPPPPPPAIESTSPPPIESTSPPPMDSSTSQTASSSSTTATSMGRVFWISTIFCCATAHFCF
ncbi:expressed unknown protein [Seminavis robusta]|uniref:Uncharacterized protein n=1 Tax=Seminavis robusta TaxID=568900 RepID=A0A9N8HPU6_9STRA|nr:expressed unknown protein [Seminavis robusta]|eukprot:Sro1365_g266520.1 n/a (492) ;mRNA; f:9137-10612